MTWIVDSSVAVKWMVREAGCDAARRLIGATLLAPDLMIVEVANAAWKKWRRREISAEVARLLPPSAATFVSIVPAVALTEFALTSRSNCITRFTIATIWRSPSKPAFVW